MRRFLLSLCMVIPFLCFAQEANQLFQSKTHMVSTDEMLRMHENGRFFTATPPPGGQVRSIAEFEPNQGVIISYKNQFGLPVNLIAEMSQGAIVYTIVPNQTTQNQVSSYYASNGVNMQNCLFVQASIDSYWSRDYSPWFIADSTNHVAIVDFPYNRPRPNDDNIPVVMANYLNMDLYGMNLEHTGGNYMTDGLGIAASTDLVASENASLSLSQINQYVNDYLGIHTYHLLDDPLGDYIEHIDCWGKFLAVDKVLIGEVPSSDPRFQDYEVVADFFKNQNCSYGYPYKVFRSFSPNGQPYTNSFILNNKVFVPVVSSYGYPWNDSALAVYQRAMPGYDIIGIYPTGSISWYDTDALHCRTHEVPDAGMLYIHHIPYFDTLIQQTTYPLDVTIIPYSDSALIADSLHIYYRYNSGGWSSVLLSHDTLHQYTGVIPDSSGASAISYYIHATDRSGRSENHPYMGAKDPHEFYISPTGAIADKSMSPKRSSLFPNPCDDIAFLKLPGTHEPVVVNIFSFDGKLIFRMTKAAYTEGEVLSIATGEMAQGIYLIEVKGRSFRENHKLLIVH